MGYISHGLKPKLYFSPYRPAESRGRCKARATSKSRGIGYTEEACWKPRGQRVWRSPSRLFMKS